MAQKKPIKPALQDKASVNVRRFRVNAPTTNICYGNKVFAVNDGLVELPNLPLEQCWYQSLIDAGMLIEA